MVLAAGARDERRPIVRVSRTNRQKQRSRRVRFSATAQWLATVKNPSDEPARWNIVYAKVPFAEFEPKVSICWGSAVLCEGETIYIYGYQEQGGGPRRKKLIVARTVRGKVNEFANWEFQGKKGWSRQPSDLAMLADSMASEFSVTRNTAVAGYLMVLTQDGLSDHIVARRADHPEGPWSETMLLYTCPEMARDKGVFSYAAKGTFLGGSGEREVADQLLCEHVGFWTAFHRREGLSPTLYLH